MRQSFFILTLSFLFAPLSKADQVPDEITPVIVLKESKHDSKLEKGQAKYIFTFENISAKSRPVIHYSIDQKSEKKQLDKNGQLTVMSTPGEHHFQFYYNSDYREVYSGPLPIKDQEQSEYIVYFQQGFEVMEEKPVIYLYPKKKQEIEVKIDIKGSNIFTYPEYNGSWNFVAQPDGKLQFGERSYNYLFWEASQKVTFASNELTEGFYVKGSEAVSFLEDKLTKAGLTSTEQADFITYWAPRLAQNEYNFIHFNFNEVCNQYAELNITPKPDNIYRIYMLWYPTEKAGVSREQKIIPATRSGFTVIEWGGMDISTSQNIKNSAL